VSAASRRHSVGLALACVLLCSSGCNRVRQPNTPLPDTFRAVTFTDDALDRSTLEGRPWVISVWRPGCKSCMRQLKVLDALKARFRSRGIGFLALSLEADEADVFDAAAHAEVDSTLAVAQGEAMGPLGLKEVPSTVLLDERATIVATLTGLHDEAELERWIKVAAP
jgi:hypothetical protein